MTSCFFFCYYQLKSSFKHVSILHSDAFFFKSCWIKHRRKNMNATIKTSIPKYFYTGNRKTQILHTRLRTKCSSLNSDLYSKNITESPFCHCGQVENSHHYLFCCPLYTAQRNELFNAVSEYQTISLNLLLYGDASLPYTTNVLIFEKVQKYISDTKRF